MEAPGKYPERVAENFWFVFSAYFLVIAAWYAVSGNGFISSRWRTVAETRKRGQRHLFLLSLPTSNLAVYVYFQAKSGDYKEVCLTLVVFVAAILHMLRTVLGLWQLYVFKHWVIRSIGSMESLGYRIELSGTGDGKNTHRGRSPAAAEEQGRPGVHFDAENIIVNDTIVCNRLSEGYVQCYHQRFTPKQKHGITSARGCVMRALLTLCYAVESTACLGRIVWLLLFSRCPLYSKPDLALFLRPREAEELWLRWASVLVSCAFPSWVTDMKKSRPEESTSQKSEYQVYRDRFAEDLLRSAALHCRRDTCKTSSCRLLPFHHWRKFPMLSSGRFCKQEFLKHACTTGNGLPFQAPHERVASRRGEDLVYSYAKYRSKLEQARDALPVNEGETLACFGIEELEWLSIFLSIEDWSIGAVEEDIDHENLSNFQPPKPISSGIAIENLCNQLGFPGNVKDFSKRLPVPFLNVKEGGTLWGNRNVLTLSVLVDNWLALLAGDQVAYMAQQVPTMKEGFLFCNLKENGSANRTQIPVGLTEGIPEKVAHLENQRFTFQLSATDSEFSHFEQSLTFLGCSMENLRSSMAKWVESNPEEQSGAWEPTLGSSRVRTDAMNGGKFEFRANKDFELCLSGVSSVSCWSQRYLQMRLLWELQNNLHNTLPECGLSPNQTEAILLCLLSFPAIRVIASEIEQTPESTVSVQGNRRFCCITIDEKPLAFQIEDCKLTLRASYGPQNVHIEVFFTRLVKESGIVVTAQLCGDDFEKGESFVWEAWRDAFYESLQRRHQWQVEHQIATSSLSVRPRTDIIGKGICEIETGNSGIGRTMKVWKGWPPHRETLSKYEIMTDGLILERKVTDVIPAKVRFSRGKRITFVERPRIQYVPVSYEEAKGQYLTHASLIARDILCKAAGCSADERSKGDRNLELLRYEISATKTGDDIALGKAVNMLISGNPNREAIERTVGLLEEFFFSKAAQAPSVRILESLSRPVPKENWVQKIRGHYEELMTATSFDPITAISFARFCSAVPSRFKEVLDEDGIRALTVAILRTTYSGNILLAFELTKSLELLLETEAEGWYYLACSIALNNIEHAGNNLSRTGNGTTLTNTQHLRRGFMSFFGTLEKSCGEENTGLIPDSKAELEKRKAEAQDRFELLFKHGTYYAGDYMSRAEELYRQRADDGDLVSAYHLACLIEYCPSPDPSRAMNLCSQVIELYTRAMNGGITSALCPLAAFYVDGIGVSRNPSYAAELYTRSIEESGDIMALYNFGYMLQEGADGVPADLPRAVRLLSRAVEEGGDVDAMNRLARLLEKGAEGVPKDAAYSARLYERAIKEHDDFRAKIFLAELLQTGADGVPVDLARAIALYESGIDEADHTGAIFNLAVLHQKGTGIPHDAVRATQLFQRAIDKDGDVAALVHLADILIEGAVGVQQDPIRAVELYTRAIEDHGCAKAMFNLGSVLEFGKNGIPADSARAFSLYNRAASEQKHRGAARRLRTVEKQKQVLEQVKNIW